MCLLLNLISPEGTTINIIMTRPTYVVSVETKYEIPHLYLNIQNNLCCAFRKWLECDKWFDSQIN